ncbi:hypothetical protein, partial [Peribacillus sp. NPDC056705]|uniref:hypothetical protein n=1 Tax=Peribacillus sp. NPDC056705 TaxID=3345918 RepID=UPI003749D263
VYSMVSPPDIPNVHLYVTLRSTLLIKKYQEKKHPYLRVSLVDIFIDPPGPVMNSSNILGILAGIPLKSI